MKSTKKYAPPPRKTRLKVTENDVLMDFLLKKMGGMSRNAVKSLLAHRQVAIDGVVSTKFDTPLTAGTSVCISTAKASIALTHPKLRIIYEDEFLVAVEKKAGLLTVATGRGDETTAFTVLKNHFKKISPKNRIFIVHRLDRETSGILVFAKSREMQLALQENWHKTVTQRTYVALVEGKMEKHSDTITSWLTENEKSLKIHSSATDNGGQKAVTHYSTVKSNEHYSLLEVNLETGRKNQIRVHLQYIDHPVAGDKKYGAQTNPLGRLGLHARVLEFRHPATQALLHFETPVPREFLHIFH